MKIKVRKVREIEKSMSYFFKMELSNAMRIKTLIVCQQGSLPKDVYDLRVIIIIITLNKNTPENI